MYKLVTGFDVLSLSDVIICHDSIDSELLKSAIITALIQIDRRHGVPVKAIAHDCTSFLQIEALANPKKEAALLSMIKKSNSIV